ncbi:MBOAT family O-acyltransferase [Cesiribacter andamanensis]|uniref:MBOAT family O-acyltransferase n=1 Tax=Cesiribacter andamanensis TaxID=649507 RepID=UPI001F1F286D|nr:MBOAT family O-acyltransferase [Cesiribacter andamanensis]
MLILFSTTLDFTVARALERSQEGGRRKKLLLLSILVNLGILACFKYFNFFMDSTLELLNYLGFHANYQLLQIILPVGISFYTFQSMSYTVDVYRRRLAAEKDFVTYATYISFFPQLLAGPIVRASDMLHQLRTDKRFDLYNFQAGLSIVLVGLFKKVVIADSLAVFVDAAFAYPENYPPLYLLLGVIFYSFQIYCDFSGYSDIAIGLARMLGFKFPLNFRMPYFSKSFSEFWERWHITLSRWLRDYLYIPLGGNRGGQFKTYRNLMLTMLLGGLWHGASWTFVFWGFLHGTYLILQRVVEWARAALGIRLPRLLNAVLSIALVYSLTCLAWVFFRSPDFATASLVLSKIASISDLSFSALPNKFIIAKGVALIALLLVVEYISLRVNLSKIMLRYPAFRLAAYASIIWFIALFGSFTNSQFIYFQF